MLGNISGSLYLISLFDIFPYINPDLRPSIPSAFNKTLLFVTLDFWFCNYMSLTHGNPTFRRDPACSQEETSEYEEISEQELNTPEYTGVQRLYYSFLDHRLHTSCICDSGTDFLVLFLLLVIFLLLPWILTVCMWQLPFSLKPGIGMYLIISTVIWQHLYFLFSSLLFSLLFSVSLVLFHQLKSVFS